jgi:hypothetical protein
VPAAPPGHSLNVNIERAKDRIWFGYLTWFGWMVRPYGSWDYKHEYGDEYEDFGNFNYGATGAAMGIPDEVLLLAAGAVQIPSAVYSSWRAGHGLDGLNGGWGYNPAWGLPWNSESYSDDPADQAMIRHGIEYFRCNRF